MKLNSFYPKCVTDTDVHGAKVTSSFLGGAVLSHQVTGITGKHEVLNFALRTATKLDHFRDLTKMVIHIEDRSVWSSRNRFY